MKTVIEMAGQAFETPGTEPAFRNGFWTVTQEELERFAELVRADERARMAEQPAQRKPLTSQERDAQRWRFLMENSYDSESVTQFHVWEHSWEPHSKTNEPTEWKQRVRGIALIDFIDRAIEAARGIKGDA